MKACSISDASKIALKNTTRRLINLAGGLDSASAACRTSSTSLGRFQNVNDKQFVPADVIADLEADINEPLVTRALALLAGYELTPVSQAPEKCPTDPTQMVARIAHELGDLAAIVEDMDADGRRDIHELQAVADALSEIGRAAERGKDEIQRLILAARERRAA